MRFPQPTALAKRGVVKIIRLDAEARSDMFADEFEPGTLFGGEENIL